MKALWQAREHHALSYRSISMVSHYALILPDHLKNIPISEGPAVARWGDWVQITLESAKKEQGSDFEQVKRNAVIVIADIVEGAVESVVATCLRHLATDQISLRELTGHKGSSVSERDLKYAVRTWEKRLFPSIPSRVQRIAAMVSTFFPKFEAPSSSARLDAVFECRNKLTHELIVVTDQISDEAIEVGASLQEIDEFFDAAVHLILAMIEAIPGDLAEPLSPSDPRFRSG